MATKRFSPAFIKTGLFADSYDTTPHLAGQLGQIVYDPRTKAHYQYVKMSTTAGTAPAKKLVVFWKDRAAFEVTTTIGDAPGGANDIAGALCGAWTGYASAATYGWIQKSGLTVLTAATASAAGQTVVGTTVGQVVHVDAGTAPTHIPVGVVVDIGGTDATWTCEPHRLTNTALSAETLSNTNIKVALQLELS